MPGEGHAELADRARQQLLAAEILVGPGKPSWPAFDFRTANDLARQAGPPLAPECSAMS